MKALFDLRRLFRLRPFSDRIQDRPIQLAARERASVALASQLKGIVLDVGCGPGWFEYHMRDAEIKLVGIDPSPAAVELARRNAPAATFSTGSAIDIPFADNMFDGAVMFEVIEHLPLHAEVHALREVRRVLRVGSRLILSTPFADPVATISDPAWYFGHRHYSEQKLRSIFSEAGFAIEEVRVLGGIWEIATMFLFYVFKWVLRSEIPAKGFFDKKRTGEFDLGRRGFTTIFVVAQSL